MFINVVYKDAPELSISRRRTSDVDMSIERTLLVNPDCHVRVMLEYIRNKCRLGSFTQFDICDKSGRMKGLFDMPTYAQATGLFDHKKTYYIIVLKYESDKRGSVQQSERRFTVLPQVNHENPLYEKLARNVTMFLTTGEVSPVTVTPPSLSKKKK